MRQFYILTQKGKIVDVKPTNPFDAQLINTLNKFDGSNPNYPQTQAEILNTVMLNQGIKATLEIAIIPNTKQLAINWDTNVVLHLLIIE